MDWNDLRFILTIARAGTLSAAARRLGVNQTTVARRLAAAEAALGTRLFERVGGALHSTESGAAAVTRAARVEQEVYALKHGIGDADADAAGMVRITAVPVLVNQLLIPALPLLYATYPRLRIELAAEPRNLSLTRREADIALRLAVLKMVEAQSWRSALGTSNTPPTAHTNALPTACRGSPMKKGSAISPRRVGLRRDSAARNLRLCWSAMRKLLCTQSTLAWVSRCFLALLRTETRGCGVSVAPGLL
jgi:DNA-binding transcriptional LysR family regulator